MDYCNNHRFINDIDDNFIGHDNDLVQYHHNYNDDNNETIIIDTKLILSSSSSSSIINDKR